MLLDDDDMVEDIVDAPRAAAAPVIAEKIVERLLRKSPNDNASQLDERVIPRKPSSAA